MTNVVAGPWTTAPIRMPARRMTKADRARFKLWEQWFVNLLVTISERGRERLGRGMPETADETLLGSSFLRGAAVKALEEGGLELTGDMPPIPLVWPEDYSVDFAREVIRQLSPPPRAA